MSIFNKYEKGVTFNVRYVKKAKNGKKFGISRDYKKLGTKEVDEMQSKNNDNFEVYFRPNSTKFVMLDHDNNITPSQQKQLKKDGMILQTETSPGHYQSWFYTNANTWKQHNKIANLLADKYGTDKLSAKTKQVGRVPLFRNIKRNGFTVTETYTNNKSTIYKNSSQGSTDTSTRGINVSQKSDKSYTTPMSQESDKDPSDNDWAPTKEQASQDLSYCNYQLSRGLSKEQTISLLKKHTVFPEASKNYIERAVTTALDKSYLNNKKN